MEDSASDLESDISMVQEQHIVHFQDGIEKALDLLHNIDAEFETDDSQDATDWRKRIQTVKELVSKPEAVIGVVGSTGVGKSKCINALLEKELLPTSDSQACTAAPVEIAFNDWSNEPLYRATVEFIEREDWEKEVDLLLAELPKSGNKYDWHSMLADDGEEPAKCAFEKIKAMCPRVVDEQPEKLNRSIFLTGGFMERLGTTIFLGGDDLEDFSQQLRPYIGCQFNEVDEGDLELWPLISRIRIFDKADVLEAGVRLVDLPGLHDNNAARATIAGNYLSECSSILVMTPIVRAKNDKWSMDFMQSRTARELRLNGTLHHIAFVCTKTDESLDHNPSRVPDVKDALTRLKRLKKDKERLRQECEKVENVIRTIKKQTHNTALVPKRTSGQQSQPPSKRIRITDLVQPVGICNTPSSEQRGESSKLKDKHMEQLQEKAEIEEKRREVDVEIAHTQHEIKHAQILHRNRESSKSIQHHFIKVFAKEPQYDLGNGRSITIKPPKVFCVCSQMFLNMQCEEELEEVAKAGFQTAEDTGIPALRKHCASFAIDLRMKAFDRFYNALYQIINSLNLWATDGIDASKLTEEEFRAKESELQEGLIDFRLRLAALVDKTVERTETELAEDITLVLSDASSKAISEVDNVLKGWEQIMPATFRAIVRRNGVYTNSRGIYFNLNHDLGQPFSDALKSGWLNFFNKSVVEAFTRAAKNCTKQINRFDERSCKQLRAMGAYNRPLIVLKKQSVTTAKMAEGYFEDAKQTILKRKSARKTIFPAIATEMEPGYEMTKGDSGPGVWRRTLRCVGAHVHAVKGNMFQSATEHIDEDLSETLQQAKKTLIDMMGALVKDHIKDYQCFLTDKSREIRARQIAHSKVIFPMISAYQSGSLNSILNMFEELGDGKYRFAADEPSESPESEAFDDHSEVKYYSLTPEATNFNGRNCLPGTEQCDEKFSVQKFEQKPPYEQILNTIKKETMIPMKQESPI